MQTGVLKTKLERFNHGIASPAEVKQIDAWLSNGNYMKLNLTEKERRDLHNYILYDVQCYTAYPLFYPKKNRLSQKDNVDGQKYFMAHCGDRIRLFLCFL